MSDLSIFDQFGIPAWAEPTPIPQGIGYGHPSTFATGAGQIANSGGLDPNSATFLSLYAPMLSGFGYLNGVGTFPSFGGPAFGNTALPTQWVNYPNVGNVPMAIGLGDPQNTQGLQHIGQKIKPT